MAAMRVGAVRDELGDHRIVEHRDLAALVDAGVVAHGDAVGGALGRRAVLHQTADGRQEVAERVLGIDAALDRPAVDLHVRLLEGQLLAGRRADHQLDEVDAGDQLGDRMLDLQARIHLQEEEAAVLAGDELDRAGAVVADGLGEGDGLLAHGPARLLVEQRRGRLLDDLLVAALDRALALVEVDDVAVLVADAAGSRCGAGSTMNFSMNMRSSPNEALASDRASGKPSSTSLRLKAMRMPLPPPPAEAFIITG